MPKLPGQCSASSMTIGRAKTALMAALIRDNPVGGPTPGPGSALQAVATPKTVSKADVTPEPSVTTPDEWFERRLRVFERALTALEAKSEATALEQARVIAELRDRLKGSSPSESMSAPSQADAQAMREAVSGALPEIAQVHSLDPIIETQDATPETTQAEMPVLDEVSLKEPATEQPMSGARAAETRLWRIRQAAAAMSVAMAAARSARQAPRARPRGPFRSPSPLPRPPP